MIDIIHSMVIIIPKQGATLGAVSREPCVADENSVRWGRWGETGGRGRAGGREVDGRYLER